MVGFGLNEYVDPGCPPLADNVTAPVNPPDGFTVIVYVVDPPRGTLWLAGAALSVKSPPPPPLTTKVADVEWLSDPLVPLIVSG